MLILIKSSFHRCRCFILLLSSLSFATFLIISAFLPVWLTISANKPYFWIKDQGEPFSAIRPLSITII